MAASQLIGSGQLDTRDHSNLKPRSLEEEKELTYSVRAPHGEARKTRREEIYTSIDTDGYHFGSTEIPRTKHLYLASRPALDSLVWIRGNFKKSPSSQRKPLYRLPDFLVHLGWAMLNQCLNERMNKDCYHFLRVKKSKVIGTEDSIHFLRLEKNCNHSVYNSWVLSCARAPACLARVFSARYQSVSQCQWHGYVWWSDSVTVPLKS